MVCSGRCGDCKHFNRVSRTCEEDDDVEYEVV